MSSLLDATIPYPLGCAVVSFIVPLVIIAFRRLYFHPLRHIPGPPLAAITSLYKTYYEVVRGGELLQKILDLHLQYGPVVRIGPNEVHFNDRRAYFQIYCVASRYTKEPDFYRCFGASDSAFGTIDPHASKIRRGVLKPFFSRSATFKLENIIQEKVQGLVEKLRIGNSTPANLFYAYRCATMDIITTYVFGRCVDALEAPEFRSPLLLDIQAALPLLWIIKSFPWILSILSILPTWLGGPFSCQYQAFMGIRRFIGAWLNKSTKSDLGLLHEMRDIAICPRLLDQSPTRPHVFPSPDSLVDEALSLLQAGSDTVGNTCTIGTIYILNNENICAKLVAELRSAWPDEDDTIGFSVLERLPFLTAVIKESLRLSHGFVTPLPRIVGPEGALIAGVNVPAKTVVGMSAACVHMNEAIFPNASVFLPERWLRPSSNELDGYLVSFSKGPRMCLGIHMAWAELYLIFGHIFRKLNLEIVDSVGDLQSFKDYLVPQYRGNELKVRVKELQA